MRENTGTGQVLKRTLLLVLTAFMLFGCSKKNTGNGSDIRVYTNESKFNSDTNNIWKKFYLLDDKTYVLTIDAVDSQDATRATVNFVMKGTYSIDGNTLFIEPGIGYAHLMNGDIPVDVEVTPDSPDIYDVLMGAHATSFTIHSEGTFDMTQ